MCQWPYRSTVMPDGEQDPRHAYRMVRDELMLDGNSRQNLATFCQTWLEPEVHALMDLTLDKNMIDKDEYPQTAELEERCVHMLADLWNSPEACAHRGNVNDGFERGRDAGRNGAALELAGQAPRCRAIDRPTQSHHRPRSDLLAQVHQVLGRRASGDPDGGRPPHHDAEEVLKRVDENTIGVVPTLGVTFTGDFEPVKEVNDALDELAADTGLDIPIHVDGASGAFLAPFTAPDLDLGLSPCRA